MKKHYLLKFIPFVLTLLLLLVKIGNAQTPVTVVIGNTSGSSAPNYGPIDNGGFLNQIYSRSGYIYTAAELGIPAGSSILKLEWLSSSGASIPGPNIFNVWLSNTTVSTFPSTIQWGTLLTGAVHTYANSSFPLVISANSYMGNTFNVPANDSFVYTGNNLQILTDWTQGSAGAIVLFNYQAAAGKAVGTRSSSPLQTSSFLQSNTFGNSRPTMRITYLPPSPCNSMPMTGPAFTYTSTVCANTPFTLAVQNPVAGSGITYLWQRASDSLFTTGLTNLGTTAIYSTTESVASYYRCIVTCTASGLSYITPYTFVELTPHYLCYCYSTSGSANSEDILNFSLGSLNNSSTCTSVITSAGSVLNKYSNFQYLSAPMVAKLSTVPYSIEVGDCSGSNYANRTVVFIDYNHDGVFDASEMADTSNGPSQGPHIVSGNILIPATALDGITGMRVIVDELSGPFNLSTIACATYNWGETEDYLINIVTPGPCTGTPFPGNTLVSANPVCAGTTVNLSLQYTPLSTGNTFQWVKNNIPITGATNTTYSTVITATDSFYCNVTCNGSGLTGASSTVGFGLISFLNCYCSSTATSDADEDIYKVTVNGASTNPLYANANNCFGSAAPGPGSVINQYSNFMTLGNLTSVVQGATVPFEVRVNDCDGAPFYPNGVGIWIDYNHNGSFQDPGETVYVEPTISVATGPSPSGDKVVTGTFVVPANTLVGQTAMRVVDIEGIYGAVLTILPCLSYPFGETEDYLININSPGPSDPAISAIAAPVGNNCKGANESISATVCNYGSAAIDLTLHPVYVTYKVHGPNGLTLYSDTLNTGILPASGTLCVTSTVTGVNMYTGGNYTINAVVTCPGIGNNFSFNDSLPNAVVIYNYRPHADPPYVLCQNAGIPLGQGLSVNGCPPTSIDSMTLTFAVSLCNDNVGATVNGNGTNAHCADMYACSFASAIIPALPSGATFVQPGKLTITNLAQYLGGIQNTNDQVRMNLFSGNPSGANLYSPAGNAYCIVAGGTQSNYTYQREIPIAHLNNLFSSVPVGSTLNIGYWESFNNNISVPDITTGAGGNTTVATLKIYYQSGSAGSAWYDVPTGGTSLFPLSVFNPLFVPNALVNNSGTPGTYTFYAACSSDSSCRIPVNLVIQQGPFVFQDSMLLCEDAVASNNAIFNLTTQNGFISGSNLAVSVSYFGDQSLFSPITNPTAYSSSTNFIYSKVYDAATGCSSSDSVYLQVSSLPQFNQQVYSASTCLPDSIDISSVLSVFNLSPIDTFFYSDPSYTSVFVNPHAIGNTDTVYMIVKTTNSAACADTSVAYIDVHQCGIILHLKCFIEGYWNGMYGMLPVLANQFEPTTATACDTIDVALHYSYPPYAVMYSTRTILNQDGTATCYFPGNFGDYYISVTHRNAVATWSATTVSLGNTPLFYDFTNNANKAYGNNQVEVANGIWAFYSGDISSDENVDLLDLNMLEVSIYNFAYGYMATDLNGDGNVDLLDSPILEDNINNFIFSNHP